MSEKTKVESSLVVKIKSDNIHAEVVIDNDKEYMTRWTLWTTYDCVSRCVFTDEKVERLMEIIEVMERIREVMLGNKCDVCKVKGIR